MHYALMERDIRQERTTSISTTVVLLEKYDGAQALAWRPIYQGSTATLGACRSHGLVSIVGEIGIELGCHQ